MSWHFFVILLVAHVNNLFCRYLVMVKSESAFEGKLRLRSEFDCFVNLYSSLRRNSTKHPNLNLPRSVWTPVIYGAIVYLCGCPSPNSTQIADHLATRVLSSPQQKYSFVPIIASACSYAALIRSK